jgi:hypothetical protein
MEGFNARTVRCIFACTGGRKGGHICFLLDLRASNSRVLSPKSVVQK